MCTSALCFPAVSVVLTLANLEGEETFDSPLLGQADEVVQERVCDDELILVKGYVGGATPEGVGWGVAAVCQLCYSQCGGSWQSSECSQIQRHVVLPSPLPVQSPVQQPHSSSEEPMTLWWMRWNAQCMTPSVVK